MSRQSEEMFGIEENDQGEIVKVKKIVLPPDFVFSLPTSTMLEQSVPSRIEVYGKNVRFDFNQDTCELKVFQVNRAGEHERTVVFKRLPVKNPNLMLKIDTHPENVKITPNPKTSDNRNVAFRIQF